MLFDFLKQIGRSTVPVVAGQAATAVATHVEPQASVQLPDKPAEGARAARDMLSDELLDNVEWTAHEHPQRPSGELVDIWSHIPGGFKWHHYFPVYEKIFGPLRNTPVTILEIGVYRGASLKLWRGYFHPDSRIVGIDIDTECARYDDAANNIFVRIGSQADDAFLQSLVQEFGPFDLIIDDGSHRSSHMLASFNALFLSGLKPEGIYFVEDTHANYWASWMDSRVSFVDVAKYLVDLMHDHHTDARKFYAFMLGDARREPVLSVPLITTLIDEIRFFDSIVVLYKKPKPTPPVVELLATG